MIKRLLAGAVVIVIAAAVFATQVSATRPHLQHMSFTIVSLGPGSAGDEVAPGGNFAIAPGVPVRVTVKNFTHQVHTFTVPGLHVNAAILPARGSTPRTTTFTFVAREGGVFAWHCVVCVGQHHKHIMAGTVYAIIDPSVLP